MEHDLYFSGKIHGFSRYFIIPTKNLKPGTYMLIPDMRRINGNASFEGVLTVLANNGTNKTNPTHKKGIPMEHTGNPLIALLFALITLPILRRK